MFTRPLRFQTLPSTYNTLKHYHAHQLFDEIPKPNNNVSIHSSMKASMNQNQPCKALQILKQHIHHDGTVSVDEVCIAIALKAFPYDVRIGSQIHAFAVSSGLNLFLTVSNGLMNLYCKSGFFDLALGIFQKLRDPDTVSWNTIIKGCDKVDNAVELTLRMHGTGVRFDERTYSTVLAFCSNGYELVSLGVQVHSLIVKSGFEMDTYIGNALITLYSRWEKFVEAEKVFDEMPHRDLVSWNAMISGYTQEGKDAFEGIQLFVDMVREGIKLDHVSFSSVVGACVHERNIGVGRQIHCSIVKTGHEKHLSVCNVLISMYSKCDVVSDANKVFYGMDERNVISWTTMISIHEEDALSLFCKMRSDGVYPNEVTFISLIHAMVVKNSLREGEMIHGFCRKTGFVSELVVANSLLTMYTKFEEMEESKKVFDELKQRGLISWNALISGYAQNQLYREALETYFLALLECTPNTYTFGSVLNAIASAESISLTHGKRCHSRIVKLGLNTDPIVSGVLLDMYAKRGSIDESGRVFEEIPEKSLVAWTAIISAYARHGDCEAVMTLLNRMEIEKVKPDLITFLAVLSSCSRGGLLDMGRSIFYSMVNDHNLEPSPEHYSCMVDMLGRAGRLKEAEKFLQQMPGKPGLSALQSLLGACKMYGNVDMGIRVGELLMDMEPTESGSYVLMSNMYAEKGEWENVAKIRMKMRSRGVKKEIGFSWADIGGYADGYMHGFSSDDQSHPKTEEIYNMVECLGSAMTSLKRGQIEHLLCDP